MIKTIEIKGKKYYKAYNGALIPLHEMEKLNKMPFETENQKNEKHRIFCILCDIFKGKKK